MGVFSVWNIYQWSYLEEFASLKKTSQENNNIHSIIQFDIHYYLNPMQSLYVFIPMAFSLLVTARNEVGARLCFYRRL